MPYYGFMVSADQDLELELLSFHIGFPPPPREWRDCFGLTLEDVIGSQVTARGHPETPPPGLHAPTIREYGDLEVAVQRLTGPEALEELVDEHGLYSVFKHPDGSINPLLRNIRGLHSLGVNVQEAFAMAPRLRSGILVRFSSDLSASQTALDLDLYLPDPSSFRQGIHSEVKEDWFKLAKNTSQLMRCAVPVTQRPRLPDKDIKSESMSQEMRGRLGEGDAELRETTSLGYLQWSGSKERVQTARRFGNARPGISKEERREMSTLVAVWDGSKRKFLSLKAKGESKDFFQLLWDEERERLTKLREDVQTVLSEIATEPEADELSKAERANLSRELTGCLSVFNKHLAGIQVTVDTDGSDIHVVLSTPSLEAATFASILLSRTKDWEYRKCLRKNCGGYFPVKRHGQRQIYCDTYCQRTKNKEEKDELALKKDALRQRVYRRRDAGDLTQVAAERLIMNIKRQEDVEQLDALEKKTKMLWIRDAGRPKGGSRDRPAIRN